MLEVPNQTAQLLVSLSVLSQDENVLAKLDPLQIVIVS